MRRCSWASALVVLCIATQAAAQGFRVEDIRVEGLQRITAGTVFNYVSLKPGDVVEYDRTGDIVRELYKTGFFKDIRIEQDGDVLVIIVSERPAISEINFSGNKSIESEALTEGLKDVGLAEGRTFERSVLNRIEQELKRQYFNQGKYAVQLTSTVTPLERNRVAIDIDIVEGDTALIRQINIVGNRAFEEDDLLDEFQSSSGGWLSFITKDNQYSRPRLGGDLETLRSYYLDRGYVNFKIDSTLVTITPDKRDIYITINITEGEVYTISDISLAGELIGDAEAYFPLIRLRRGQPFARNSIVSSSDRISVHLSNLGHSFANVNSIPEIDEENKTVAVTFFVDPGDRVYVRRVNISGNNRTRDEVIRREFRQMESAWFSGERLKLSRERAQRTGFFNSVDIETPNVPGSSDEVDINVTVEEKPSGALLAGLGFSQSDGVVINASISQDNFVGTGKRVSLALRTSSANQAYQVSYVNPYYTVDGISRGFNLSYRSTDFSDLDTADYKTDDTILGVLYGIPLSESNRFRFGFDIHQIDLDVGRQASDQIIKFQDEEGDDFLNFETTLSWRGDSRDSAIFPKSGGTQAVFAELSLPGSDLKYYKLSYENQRYWPLAERLTFSLSGEIGYGDAFGDTSRLPIWENYFGGGPNTVRGFAARSLGPRDSKGDPLGGNASYFGSAELLFPPPFMSDIDTVRLVTFFDVGSVIDTDETDLFDPDELRYSAGIGGSWLSPVGALTVSYAVPINADNQDEEEEFQFNFGQTF
jgi:outer membrane protein insertion porin family